MCKKFERVTGKTGCTTCTNWKISFEVWGFWTKTRLLQKTFSAFNMHHSEPHHHFSTLLLTSFAIFHAFHYLFWAKMTLKLKSTATELWNGWKLAWYHNFTFVECAKKLRGFRGKLDALRVQTGQSPLKYEGFGRKLVYYKGISNF